MLSAWRKEGWEEDLTVLADIEEKDVTDELEEASTLLGFPSQGKYPRAP